MSCFCGDKSINREFISLIKLDSTRSYNSPGARGRAGCFRQASTLILAALATAAVMCPTGLLLFLLRPTSIIGIVIIVAQDWLISFHDAVNSLFPKFPLPPLNPPTPFTPAFPPFPRSLAILVGFDCAS